MRKILIVIGIAFLVAGVLLPYITRLPIGRLPGDIIIDKPGFKLYFPITTMIIVSIVISLISWFLNR
jgi:hypothetical protein